MSNSEIIQTEAILKGFQYTGYNLYTFQEWKKRGYSVKKGEKTFIKTRLWRKITNTNKKTGEKESKIILVTACLFNDKQVEKITQ